MFAAYERAKGVVACSIMGVIVLLIAQKELDWATGYVETNATIVDIEQSCAGGSRAPGRWIECDKAFPGATRRTILELSYVSPADGQMHRARVRCDTSGDETPRLAVGDELDVYAHESEPERLDRRRCTSI